MHVTPSIEIRDRFTFRRNCHDVTSRRTVLPFAEGFLESERAILMLRHEALELGFVRPEIVVKPWRALSRNRMAPSYNINTS